MDSSGSGASASYAVLSPATVPPVSKECSQALTTYEDGTVGPLLCGNGVNVLAWRYYAGNFPGSELFTLGRGATATQVYQAMCHDVTALHSSFPMSQGMEQLGQAYYGWNVNGQALATEEVKQSCQGS